MGGDITIEGNLAKEEVYKVLLPQIISIIEGEPDFIANISNITSALKYSLANVNWVGFYFLNEAKDELVLGPFQGKVACNRIAMGKGVCGTAAARKETIVVDNVEEFPGHIYCDSASRSEIVIPLIKDNNVIGVLDLDSDEYSNFDETDKQYLEELAAQINYLF